MNTTVKGKAIVDFEKIIAEVYEAGKKEGDENGYKRGKEEIIEDSEFKKFAADFVVEKFTDCKTLADFQDTYKLIFITHLNHMR